MKKPLVNLRAVLIGVFFCLVLDFPSAASSVRFNVTPDNLDQGGFRFSVAAKPATNGTAFHVTVTSKHGAIFADSNMSLAEPSGGENWKELEKPVSINLQKAEQTWQADFTITQGQLEKPGICLVFSVLAHITQNGKTIPMPSVEFYVVKLRDFVKH